MSTAETKPFSLQAPEAIAKQYQGNKQKIAQAVQLGLVDATAGTLAGMFIDRMRAAAMQEHGAPQTVAQQVLGSGLPVPPPGGPPMAPMAGGAPPPPMPMPQGAPPASSAAPMGGPPVRAADGGLMSIPIPDTMFDEPDNGSYANGGLVAFADAGSTNQDLADDLERRRTDAARARASMASGGYGDVGEFLGELGENAGEFMGELGENAGNFAGQLGSDYGAFQARFRALHKQKLAAQKNPENRNAPYGRGPGNANFLGPKFSQNPPPTAKAAPANAPEGSAEIISRGPMTGLEPTPERLAGARARQAALGNAPSKGGLGGTKKALANPMFSAQKAAGKSTVEGDPIADAIKKYAGYIEDPEYKAYMEGEKSKLSKQKKEDVWSTLAQIGFGMAASKSPTLLGAIGEAGTAALPTAQKAIQARRATEADFVKQRMDTRRAAITGGIGMAQNAEQVGLKREEMSQRDRQFEAQMAQALQLAQMNVGAQLAAARISLSRDQQDAFHTTLRTKIADIQSQNPNMDPRQVASLAVDATYTTMGYKNPQQGAGPGIETLLNSEGGGGRGRSTIPTGAVIKIG